MIVVVVAEYFYPSICFNLPQHLALVLAPKPIYSSIDFYFSIYSSTSIGTFHLPQHLAVVLVPSIYFSIDFDYYSTAVSDRQHLLAMANVKLCFSSYCYFGSAAVINKQSQLSSVLIGNFRFETQHGAIRE